MSITPYTNDAGEILGWDNHYWDGDEGPDPDDWYEQNVLEYENPCDYCGEDIRDTSEQVKVRRESGPWKGKSDYLHNKCAETGYWPGTHLAPDGTIIRIVEESE